MQNESMTETEPIQSEQSIQTEQTTCCIVGGGPAGTILALLLARKGISVTLLEEHMNFDRDFRGDTVHASTMQIMDEIGLVDKLLQIPHAEVPTFSIEIGNEMVTIGDLRHLKTRFPYVAIMPQAEFLEFVTAEAKKYPSFRLVMGARAEKLIKEERAVRGVQYRAKDGWHEVRAVLTVAADGRFSRIRKLAGLEPIKTSPPMDVIWFRLPMKPGDVMETGGRIGNGHILVKLNRTDSWQVGYVIPKGGYQRIRAAGLDTLQQEIVRIMPEWADRIDTLQEWKQISVLSVESSHLSCWYLPGLLLIGDAAHVMSPVGGVGINYAIQDAVVAANMLSEPLKNGNISVRDLAKVQRKRMLPTRMIQAFQGFIQQRVLATTLESGKPVTIPPVIRFLLRLPVLRTLPARLIAFGPREVHVEE